MAIQEVDLEYLENNVRIPPVQPEMFDGHGRSHVFSITHVCGPAVVADPPDAYELPSKNIGSGYYTVGLTDLGEKQQPSLPEFAAEG